MIEVARRDHPCLRFEVGSLTDLALSNSSLTGLLAWQSLIHVPDEVMPAVLERFRQALRPGGALQLLFHVGDEPWLKTEATAATHERLDPPTATPAKSGIGYAGPVSPSMPSSSSHHTALARRPSCSLPPTPSPFDARLLEQDIDREREPGGSAAPRPRPKGL